MLFTMAIVLALVSVYIEVLAVTKFPALDRLYTNGVTFKKWILFGPPRWKVDGYYFNIVGSFALSAALGKMFGAGGLVVMLGGIISTVLSQGYFEMKRTLNQRGVTYRGMHNGIGNMISGVQRAYQDFRQPIADFGKMVLTVIRIITAPVRWLRTASLWYTKRRQPTQVV